MFLSIEVTDFHLFSPPKDITDSDVWLYKSRKKETLNDLKEYLLIDGNSLDGDEIQKHLFPEDDVDIFLSHSHSDSDEAVKLAIALERKGLKVFIDSCVWGNASDLLKVIDDQYCRNFDNSMYDYNKRNHSTSHAYMMLNTALHKMIDRCEIFLFLGTPNSISVKDGIKNQESLKSPWIFSELAFIQHVRRKSSFNFTSLAESLENREKMAMDSLEVHYDKPRLDYKIESYVLENLLAGYYSGSKLVLQSLYGQLRRL
ncbi:toll/interleukin-1 receptor domain-containing protein [uncultured Psychrobacter sp.]|uniref:toll/interleukin-1 receptor domain-containing protein n=1 Tax=uncultured Psychrobacter sp. TaxID=259303 RepID=UPI0034588EE4